MRYILLFLVALSSVILSSCTDMYESLRQYSGEIVYPARFDTIVGQVGYERVELDLMKAGRIPSKKIKLGKAQKVIIKYDDQEIKVDSLVSWVNLKGLTQPKLYRFKVFTVDEYGNQSVPREIALIPYTSADLATLVMSSPRVLASPSAAVVDWPNGLNSVLLDYVSLSYSYKDKDGATKTGTRGSDSRFFISNLEPGKPVTLDIKYRVIPKANNRRILDTVTVSQPLTINVPNSSTPFTAAEQAILTQNGVTVFSADGVSKFTKLVYPIHTNTLQDLFYFPNLKELDLTGGTIFKLPTLAYDRNGAKSTVGGGDWVHFMKRVGPISAGNMQTLKDLLESGTLTKVKYVPNSMGLDALLQPYVAKGIVELETLPAESLIPNKFFFDGVIQDAAWKLDYVVPATDAPAGTGIINPIKATVAARSGSFAFVLPTQYQFNIDEYRYLKFKVYAPAKNRFDGIYAPYQRIWPRIMNYLWAFTNESTFGQEGWAPNADDNKIADADLQKWTDITIDMNTALNRHNRVIVINIGGEPSLTFAPTLPITYYFSNFRFSKTK